MSLTWLNKRLLTYYYVMHVDYRWTHCFIIIVSIYAFVILVIVVDIAISNDILLSAVILNN